jgi:hypothetical protein
MSDFQARAPDEADAACVDPPEPRKSSMSSPKRKGMNREALESVIRMLGTSMTESLPGRLTLRKWPVFRCMTLRRVAPGRDLCLPFEGTVFRPPAFKVRLRRLNA